MRRDFLYAFISLLVGIFIGLAIMYPSSLCKQHEEESKEKEHIIKESMAYLNSIAPANTKLEVVEVLDMGSVYRIKLNVTSLNISQFSSVYVTKDASILFAGSLLGVYPINLSTHQMIKDP